jgi:hypothetical protein
MKVRPVLLTLLSALALALVATVVLDRAAPAPAPSCATADHSMTTGMVKQAQKEYMSVLGDDPSSRCATRGMWAVVAEQCQRARKLADEGARTEARAAYVAVLTAEMPYRRDADGIPVRVTNTPTLVACAVNGLARLPAPASAPAAGKATS